MREYKKERILFVLVLGIVLCAVIGITNPFSRAGVTEDSAEVEQTVSIAEAAEEVETENSVEEAIKVSPLSDERVSEKNFLSQTENLPYVPEAGSAFMISDYLVNGFKIERFDTFITIIPNNEDAEEQFISGTDFIITEDKIWFINDERKVTSFSYKDFEYPEKGADSYVAESSKEYATFQYADLDDNEVKWAKYEKYVPTEGKAVAFQTSNGTLLFKGNNVDVFNKGDSESSIQFPFTFKELGYVGEVYEEYTYYVFVSSTNTVGIIKLYDDNTIDFTMIAEGDAERQIFYPTEENGVDRIDRNNGYVIYYENQKLMGSNGALHFSFDDFEYEEMWRGDAYGVGKGFADCSILANYPFNSDVEPSVTKMVEETGINY